MNTHLPSFRVVPTPSRLGLLLCALMALMLPRAVAFDCLRNAKDSYSDSGYFSFGFPLGKGATEYFPTLSGTFAYGSGTTGPGADENIWESYINLELPSPIPPWTSITLGEGSATPLVGSFEIGVPSQSQVTMEFWGDQFFTSDTYSREYIIDFVADTTFDYDGKRFRLHGTWNYTATLIGETGVPPPPCVPDSGATWVLLVVGLAGLHRVRCACEA